MTCHCGNCEDHKPDTFPPAPGGWQWSDSVGDEAKEIIEESLAPVIKSDRPNSLAGYYGKNTEERTKMVTGRNPRDDRDIAPAPLDLAQTPVEEDYPTMEPFDPYKSWLENTDYMSKEEIADRYARFGMALSEIHSMALDSFSGKPLPEAKYMLGLCLGLAGGALNYERPNFEK